MASRPQARRRLSISRSITFVALLLGALSMMAVGTLIWTSTELGDAIVTVNRDTRSWAVADELHVSTLMYQRMSNFFLTTREPTWLASREEIAAEQERLLEQADLNAGSDAERRLVAEVQQRLEEYRAERLRLEGVEDTVEEVTESANPALERFLSVIESLRVLNEAQVSAAYERALAINRRADLAGITVAGLLVVALVLTVVAARRYVVEPIVEIEDTIERFRRGDERARAQEHGPAESADLARTFNEMAEALARMRQGQRAFAAGVAHDLRNPIGGIQVALHTLTYDRPREERRRTISLLQRQFERLTRMLDDLLDATRIEAGDLSLRSANVDLATLVEDVVGFYRPTTERHEIVLSKPERPVNVHADAHRMEQVIANLLSNAIKYSPDGGRIDVAIEADHDEARLSVRDHGIGMSAHELRDIFAPFQRKRPELAEGTGLGLSVTQGLVRAHGGRIGVESEPGRGSTFTVHLPLRPRDDHRAPGGPLPAL